MIRTIQLLFIIGLFAQQSYGQARRPITTLDEYRAQFAALTENLRRAEKDSTLFIGKTVAEFEEKLNEYGIKIVEIWALSNHRNQDSQIIGVRLNFVSSEVRSQAQRSGRSISFPSIVVFFEYGKPYCSIPRPGFMERYSGEFKGKRREFYLESVIAEISFWIPERIERRRDR